MPLLFTWYNNKYHKLPLGSDQFPDDFKHAHVALVLKNVSLLKDHLKIYRPIPNLSFVSTILEKVVASRLGCYISLNHLSNAL